MSGGGLVHSHQQSVYGTLSSLTHHLPSLTLTQLIRVVVGYGDGWTATITCDARLCSCTEIGHLLYQPYSGVSMFCVQITIA